MKVFGFAGRSGSGKTTLMERVIPLLAAGGLRVSVIKHTHHAFDVDRPGKDSYRHRAAAGTAPLFPGDPHIVALAADVAVHGELPIFGLTDYAAIAAFIRAHVGLDLPETAVHENGAALRNTRRPLVRVS